MRKNNDKNNFLFVGEKVSLRKLKLSDAPVLYKYAKDPAVIRTTLLPSPYKFEHATQFIRKSFYAAKKNRWHVFAVVGKTSGEVIGVTGIHKIDSLSKKAEIGYWIGKKHWGNGFATEAVAVVLPFCFRTLKLRRLYACTLGNNVASNKILLRNGFKPEGCSRKDLFRLGKWHDVNHFALLKEEYKGKQL